MQLVEVFIQLLGFFHRQLLSALTAEISIIGISHWKIWSRFANKFIREKECFFLDMTCLITSGSHLPHECYLAHCKKWGWHLCLGGFLVPWSLSVLPYFTISSLLYYFSMISLGSSLLCYFFFLYGKKWFFKPTLPLGRVTTAQVSKPSLLYYCIYYIYISSRGAKMSWARPGIHSLVNQSTAIESLWDGS